MLSDYLPTSVNTGPWVNAYTLPELKRRRDAEFVLPICSLVTPYRQCAALGELVLPPLFREALTDDLQQAIVDRIGRCVPNISGGRSDSIRVVELPAAELPTATPGNVLAFSVDTAVEEHGPHLPLATDTIQSYSVLRELEREYEPVELARPLEYGQLTWGLPFGFSVDIGADLLQRYVANYTAALVRWRRPQSIYVVDVHGSIVHRTAIVDGLRESGFPDWTFRWLHEPLAEFASARGDQHAGGVETALVERVSPELLDPAWWPDRIDQIAAGQLSFDKAVELAPDLEAFAAHVRDHELNGVVGEIRNYQNVDADEMFDRMLQVARRDIEAGIDGRATQTAGEKLW